MALAQLREFVNQWGKKVSDSTKSGMRTEIYDVLGKRWAFVSPAPDKQKCNCGDERQCPECGGWG